MSLLTSLLVPGGGHPPTVMEPASMSAFGGAPNLATGAGTPVWLLDGAGATDEGVIFNALVPAGATRATVKVRWAQWAAGTGNVVWRLRWRSQATGELVTGGLQTETEVTVAVSGANQQQQETILGSSLTVTAGDIFVCTPDRRPGQAGDTFGSDIGVALAIVEWA